MPAWGSIKFAGSQGGSHGLLTFGRVAHWAVDDVTIEDMCGLRTSPQRRKERCRGSTPGGNAAVGWRAPPSAAINGCFQAGNKDGIIQIPRFCGYRAMSNKCNCQHCGRSFAQLWKHLRKAPECAAAYAEPAVAPSDINERQREADKRKVGDQIYSAALRAHVFEDVAEWYFFRYFGATRMTAIASAVERWTAFALKETAPDLEHLLGPAAAAPVMSARCPPRRPRRRRHAERAPHEAAYVPVWGCHPEAPLPRVHPRWERRPGDTALPPHRSARCHSLRRALQPTRRPRLPAR